MKTIISITLLKHLSKQIAHGNVLWALLTLNEYGLPNTDHIANSLRIKAKCKIAESHKYLNYDSVCTTILNGATMQDLSHSDKTLINGLESNAGANKFKSRKIILTNYFKHREIRYNNTYLSPRPSSLCNSRKRSYALVNSTKREASSGD